jgi:hypothetical protein
VSPPEAGPSKEYNEQSCPSVEPMNVLRNELRKMGNTAHLLNVLRQDKNEKGLTITDSRFSVCEQDERGAEPKPDPTGAVDLVRKTPRLERET